MWLDNQLFFYTENTEKAARIVLFVISVWKYFPLEEHLIQILFLKYEIVLDLLCKTNYHEVIAWFCFQLNIFLEDINLILAITINIISQPIEYLNISSVYIVCSNSEMQVIPYSTVNVYTAILIKCLSVTWVAQWVTTFIFLSSEL